MDKGSVKWPAVALAGILLVLAGALPFLRLLTPPEPGTPPPPTPTPPHPPPPPNPPNRRSRVPQCPNRSLILYIYF